MPAQLAILLCSIGIVVLFYLNRNEAARTSRGLWVPVVWVWLAGSRPVSMWLGMSAPHDASANVEGSPVEAAIFGVLLAIGVIILGTRAAKTQRYLAVILPVILYSVYCLISVTWSPIPVPALKRWAKDVGDVVMALVICTDTQPIEALRRLYARVGFILFPLSIVLIRYTTLGRAWDNDGNLSNVGISDNKNALGLIVFVISLGALWNVRWLFVNKGEPNRRRRLVAEGILLVSGVALLAMAHSSTSLACFLLGSGLMLTTQMRMFKRRPSRVYGLCVAILLVGALVIIAGGSGGFAGVLGRDSTLTGRTDIWAALIPAASNPVIGTGFESFWNSPNVSIFYQTLTLWHWYKPEHLNEAHNGYLEIYLNLGWIGVCLIALILITGCARACRSFRRNRDLGGLMLSYIITGAIYSVTEAGFRTLNAMWIFVLLAVVTVSGVNAQLFGEETTECLGKGRIRVGNELFKRDEKNGWGWESRENRRDYTGSLWRGDVPRKVRSTHEAYWRSE
jgi:exopolysaccharide production protein ExoQ